jgi:hypothetical protein
VWVLRANVKVSKCQAPRIGDRLTRHDSHVIATSDKYFIPSSMLKHACLYMADTHLSLAGLCVLRHSFMSEPCSGSKLAV